MIDPDLKREFDRDGFVCVRGFLGPTDLGQLQRNLNRYIDDVVPGLPDSAAFYQDRSRPETLKQLQHMGCDEYFNQYREHARWKQMAELLLGEPAAAQEPEWFNKPPATTHPTPPHQDNYYFCLRPPHVVTMWVALDAADEENGCLRYVPGSHLSGLREHGRSQVLGFSQGIVDYNDCDRNREVAMLLEPGDLIAHHGETIHRADENHSQRHRRAFAMVFRGESCRRDDAAYERYSRSAQEQHMSMGLDTEGTF